MQNGGKAMKTKAWKIALATVAILLLLVVLSVVVYWGVIGVTGFEEGMQHLSELFLPKENNVYRKASYSVSDEKAEKKSDHVVAKVGDTELTNGLLQIFYWMDVYEYLEDYGYYAVYYGLDYTQPLDQQNCKDTEGTWQHFFLDKAILNWHSYQALAKMAAEEGIALDEEFQTELDNLRASLTEAVLESEYGSIDAMLQADVGAGCDYDDYYRYMDTYYRGYSYLKEKVDQFEITDQMLQDYYDAHTEELAEESISKESGNVMDVRHILIAVKGGTEDEDGEVTYSDAEWEACKAEAQKVLDEWLAGDATEESFAELAYTYSEDTGSNENGGLYQNLDAKSGFVQEFIDWYMDDNRKPGDYGLIRTDYGYHVMYFVESEAQWLRNCRQGVMTDKTSEILADARERFPMEVEYKKIALAVVDFSEEQE
jgi:hypothetical protein